MSQSSFLRVSVPLSFTRLVIRPPRPAAAAVIRGSNPIMAGVGVAVAHYYSLGFLMARLQRDLPSGGKKGEFAVHGVAVGGLIAGSICRLGIDQRL